MKFAQRGMDELRIESLEAVESPTDDDKVSLCCLLMRYQGDPEFGSRTCDIIASWGHSPDTLMNECREIWLSGYNPTSTEINYGSGNDTETVPA